MSTSIEPETLPASKRDEVAIAHMAQVLAHRLRGLVTGIEGFTDLLIDSLGTREQRDLALRILESASQIERILVDLQRYSQTIQPVLRNLFISEAVDTLLVALEDADVERIKLDVQVPTGCQVHADPILLRQALLVILQNALDATSKGGEVQFSVQHDPVRHVVQFDIRNEGAINLEDADAQVFMPFFTTKAQNLGVGLSIARRIAEAHNGSLELLSEAAETCFRLTLKEAPVLTPGT